MNVFVFIHLITCKYIYFYAWEPSFELFNDSLA
jgi:hypothetical protein